MLLKKAGLHWDTAKMFEDSLIIHLAKVVDHGVSQNYLITLRDRWSQISITVSYSTYQRS